MEMFQAPMREVESRFTKSELVALSWRSQEIYSKMKVPPKGAPVGTQSATEAPAGKRNPQLGTLPGEFINSDGELDLRGVTGDKAWQFLMRQGIHVPMLK